MTSWKDVGNEWKSAGKSALKGVGMVIGAGVVGAIGWGIWSLARDEKYNPQKYEVVKTSVSYDRQTHKDSTLHISVVEADDRTDTTEYSWPINGRERYLAGTPLSKTSEFRANLIELDSLDKDLKNVMDEDIDNYPLKKITIEKEEDNKFPGTVEHIFNINKAHLSVKDYQNISRIFKLADRKAPGAIYMGPEN